MNKVKRSKKKIGIALGSGGVRGLAHIGVLKQLEKMQIPIDYIAGSSIGALIGALYSVWGSAERLEKFVLEHSTFRNWLALMDPTLKGGFMAGNKVERLLHTQLKRAKFEDLNIPLVVVATDLQTGDEVHLQTGDVGQAVRSSIAATPVFTPVKKAKWLLADGGLSNPVPDDVVRTMGADIVLAVNLDSSFQLTPLPKLNITDVAYRALTIIRHHFSNQTISNSDIILEPDIHGEKLVGFNDFFKMETVRQNILSGEIEVKRHAAAIRRMVN
ncbi:MAG: patatin-like phospholipase family protein [Patescibacteria group bacterium]|jgi:NTE family protein